MPGCPRFPVNVALQTGVLYRDRARLVHVDNEAK
jgi:hypothetical protein